MNYLENKTSNERNSKTIDAMCFGWYLKSKKYS